MNKRKKSIICLAATLLLTASLGGCQPTKELADLDLTLQTSFADYKEVPVNAKPSVKAYKTSANLSNLVNKDRFAFSDEAKKLLVQNNFVVIPTNTSEFFSSYESNRYDWTPNFVTTDAMLHNYHLYFSYLLRTMEKDVFCKHLNLLTQSMLEKSELQYDALKDTEWENASKRNVAFFAVAAKLLNLDLTIPSYVGDEVNTEYQLISKHQESFASSPVMNIGNSSSSLNEDYTQYSPRGHYTKSNELKRYFKTMMWYGRMSFRTTNDDETKSAVLITLLLNSQDVYDQWNSIYEPTNFFVGKSDDLEFTQYITLLNDSYGKIPDLSLLKKDFKRWDTFLSAVQKLDPPSINSIPIFDESIQPNRDESVKAFRFMGQRFTLDGSIFQRLVYREVGENSSKERRMLPKGLDIPAAMGSQEAYSILDEMGETDYKNYPENMKKIQTLTTSLDTKTQTQNLYFAWLYTLSPLTQPKEAGYPSFMQNQAWTRKQLETYLSSWTELKHDTVLYAKQVYAEMGGGDEEQDDRGYVEPNPEVYARLASLSRMMIDGLQSRNLLDKDITASLEQLEELSLKLKLISEKELAEQDLSDEDYDLIRSFGGQLEHFWIEALKDENVDPSAACANPAALISDVATDPNGQVLQEGTGYINEIYVVVPVAGSLRIARGAVYSYYEFTWPSKDRLTDEKWKNILQEGLAPDTPSWAKSYTAPKGSLKW